ncbi:MAG TPA: lipo-like protein [Acidiferrobacteraceae bacterium]|nr:lipo-like protein [Acidiferrobacteraceae bacterium]
MEWCAKKIGSWIAHYLEKPLRVYQAFSTNDTATLQRFLQPGDVLLVEGNHRISIAIKYLTQSTWSHAALYIGNPQGLHTPPNSEDNSLVEALASTGVVAVPLSKYAQFNTRICRPVGLTDEDRDKLVQFALNSIGKKYDLKNIFDLVRYLFPNPPVPIYWRRCMLTMGSGDPTRAICSTLIAQAFQSIHYPILPSIEKRRPCDQEKCRHADLEILHARHYSLFTPRDFDISPYFRTIKPTIEDGFDYRKLEWADHPESDKT